MMNAELIREAVSLADGWIACDDFFIAWLGLRDILQAQWRDTRMIGVYASRLQSSDLS